MIAVLIYHAALWIPATGIVYVFLQEFDPSKSPSLAWTVALGSLVVMILREIFGFLRPILDKRARGSANRDGIGGQSVEFTEQLIRDEMSSVLDDRLQPHMDQEIQLLRDIAGKLDRLNTNMEILKDRRTLGSRYGEGG